MGKIEQFQYYRKEQNIIYLFQRQCHHTSRSLAMYASTLQACAASYAWIGSAISTNLTLFYTDWNAQQGNTNMFFVSICFQMFYLGTNLTFLMIFDIEVHLTSRSVAIARTLQTFAACPIGANNLVSTNFSLFETSCCKK